MRVRTPIRPPVPVQEARNADGVLDEVREPVHGRATVAYFGFRRIQLADATLACSGFLVSPGRTLLSI